MIVFEYFVNKNKSAKDRHIACATLYNNFQNNFPEFCGIFFFFLQRHISSVASTEQSNLKTLQPVEQTLHLSLKILFSFFVKNEILFQL